jgi:DNA-binding transcriptional MerR regulator
VNVAALAERAGVSPHTIRYYEKAGLIAAPGRTRSGYRDYDGSEVDRLRFIQGCQRLGLRLREIKSLLVVRDTGECPCGPASELLQRRLSELDGELARLHTVRDELAAMAARIPGRECPDPVPGSWQPVREEVDSDGRSVPVLRRPAV